MAKCRVHIRLSYDLMRSLDEAAAPRGVTKSALVEDALHAYFRPEDQSSREAAILDRLNRFDLRQSALERDTALITETLGQFVLYWLMRTEPLPEGEREIAHNLGQKRFDYFIDQVAQKLGSETGLTGRVFPDLGEPTD